MQSDEELVRLSQDSHKEAFNELVRRYYRLVFNTVFPRIREISSAEDVVQETFLRAFQMLGKCRRGSEFAGWLSTIARRVSQNWLRKNRRYLDLLNKGLERGDAPDRKVSEMISAI
jgi:RNA polymerase sigma factor (sigma-70 family)